MSAGRDAVICGIAKLSPRERTVFDLLLLGHTNAAIGEMLGIKGATVDSHKKSAALKLGCEVRQLPWNLVRMLLKGDV